jgi:hypothetical protein
MVMKKLFAAILFLVYGLSSSGMTLHLHYCCGKLKNVQLTPVEKKHCGTTKQHSVSKPCCNEKEISLKLKGDYDAAKILFAGLQAPVILATIGQSSNFELRHSTSLIPEVFAPPLLEKDISSLYCVFRI